MVKRIGLIWLLSLLLLGACRSGEQLEPEPLEGTPPASSEPESTLAPEELYPEAGVIRQWGLSAEASSEFADPEWSAAKAAGSPDAPGCGDFQFAWASAASDGIETLEITYEIPVYPLLIIIHESFNPDQVVKVEVFNSEIGGYYTVLQKNPIQVDRPCPYQLHVPVTGIDFLTSQVRVTVDQSQLGLGWNEIDAVELVGSLRLPEDSD